MAEPQRSFMDDVRELPSNLARLVGFARDNFSANSDPKTASPSGPVPAPSASGPTSCEKLATQIEQQGGSVKAGQQRMAISCGLGGT